MQAPTILEEILMVNIFPRVHPTTILRCRYLNRFFYNYLSSQEFIYRNYRHSLNTSSHRLLIIITPNHDLYSIDTESPHSPPHLIPLPPLPPVHSPGSHFDVVGACFGILCLRRPHHSHSLNMIDFEFIFLNPAIGAYVTWPRASLDGIWLQQETKVTRFGFGFDGVSREFKFVLIEYNQLYRNVYVYGLNRASWIHGGQMILPLGSIVSSPWYWRNVSVNGALVQGNLLHWLDFSCLVDDLTTFEISCFDVETEQWQNNVPLPNLDNNNSNTTRAVNLWALDELLCLTTMNVGTGGSLNIDVWVMETYGDQESWVKLFIASPSCNYIPLFGHELRELLLSAYYPPTFGAPIYAWYNLRDQSTGRVELLGPPHQCNVLSLTIASLFPL